MRTLEKGEPAYPGYVCITEEGPYIVKDIETVNGRPQVMIVAICEATTEKLLNCLN